MKSLLRPVSIPGLSAREQTIVEAAEAFLPIDFLKSFRSAVSKKLKRLPDAITINPAMDQLAALPSK